MKPAFALACGMVIVSVLLAVLPVSGTSYQGYQIAERLYLGTSTTQGYMAVDTHGVSLVLSDSSIGRMGPGWDDLRFQVTNLRPGSTPPTFGAVRGSIFGLLFARADEVHGVAQIPHGWDTTSAIDAHVHWAPTDAATGDCVWKLDYAPADTGDIFSSTPYTATIAQAGNGTAYRSQYADFGNLTTVELGGALSPNIAFRLYRGTAGQGDTYTNSAAAWAIEIDFHIHYKAIGSRYQNSD